MSLSFNIEKSLKVATPTAALALFDPIMIEHRRDDHRGWWQQDLDLIPEIAQGDIAVIPLKASSTYTIRFTSKGLTTEENEQVSGVIERLGLVVKSGELIVGSSALLPGGHQLPSEKLLQKLGAYITLPNGEYNLSIYALSRRQLGDSHDLVIHIKKRTELFPGIIGANALFIDPEIQVDKQLSRFSEIDEFSEYQRRQMEREGQEAHGRNVGKLRNPADYLNQAGHGQGFKAHIKFNNFPAGDMKLPNELSFNEIMDNYAAAPELAHSPELNHAHANQAAPSASTPTLTK